MGKELKKIAFVYDFDKTLCTKDMQEFDLIPGLGYKEAKDFWIEVGNLNMNQNDENNKLDKIIAYLYHYQKKFKEKNNRNLKKSDFKGSGNAIEFYPGVQQWFKRINQYGKEKGFDVKHYVISSGMYEVISDTPIADEFDRIYACRYYYDEKDEVQYPAQIVNFTTKTQYLFRINKQKLNEDDDEGVNEYVPQNDRPIPFRRMIYIADGLTDIPCMKLVKVNGGYSISVYDSKDGEPT